MIAAVAPPNLTLLALDRLDLAMYTMAGSLCASLRPQPALRRPCPRPRLGGARHGRRLAVALLAAAPHHERRRPRHRRGRPRGGPEDRVRRHPDRTAGQRRPHLHQLPPRCMPADPPASCPDTSGLAPPPAPGPGWSAWPPGCSPPARPRAPRHRPGPERRRRVRRHARHRRRPRPARAASAAAIHAAWQSLLAAGARPDRTRRAPGTALVRAEVALAAPRRHRPRPAAHLARQLRSTGRVPRVASPARTPTNSSAWPPHRPSRSGTASPPSPRSPSAPRSAAPSPDTPPSRSASAAPTGRWSPPPPSTRPTSPSPGAGGVQRVVGNLAGVLVFAALAPLAHLHPAALVLCSLALNFGAEAPIGRNYWLGSVCVTPMALLITEFARAQDPAELITDRVADTPRRRPGRLRRRRRRHQPARRRPPWTTR
ncbi:FUSC family protein [Streptomyces tricolor]|nr:FUSC family protein [Streptomyces tricolor]